MIDMSQKCDIRKEENWWFNYLRGLIFSYTKKNEPDELDGVLEWSNDISHPPFSYYEGIIYIIDCPIFSFGNSSQFQEIFGDDGWCLDVRIVESSVKSIRDRYPVAFGKEGFPLITTLYL